MGHIKKSVDYNVLMKIVIYSVYTVAKFLTLSIYCLLFTKSQLDLWDIPTPLKLKMFKVRIKDRLGSGFRVGQVPRIPDSSLHHCSLISSPASLLW